MRHPSAIYRFTAPPLILLSLLAPFVRFHRYDPLQPEILIIALAIAGIGLCLALLTRLRPVTLEPLVLGLLAAGFAMVQLFGSWGTVLSVSPLEPRTTLAACLIALPLAVLVVAWIMRRHLAELLAVGFGAMLAATFLLPVPTVAGGVVVDRRDATIDAALPPVIHLILDEQIGIEGIPTEIAGGADLVELLRRTYDPSVFALYGRAYSRFYRTQHAIVTLINGEGPEALGALVEPAAGEFRVLQNEWFERLRAQGYSIRVYQSAYLDYCNTARDLIDYCYTQPVGSIEPVQRAAMSLTDKVDIIVRSMFGWFGPILGIEVPQTSPLSAFETLQGVIDDFFRQPRGTAYFVHVLIPHFAYIYDERCDIRPDPATWLNTVQMDTDAPLAADDRESRYKLYFNQVACVTRTVAEFFQKMRSRSLFDDATIIVHGDHGSRITTAGFKFARPPDLSDRDLVDLFSTLFAVKAPQGAAGYSCDMRSIQSLFGTLFLDAIPRPSGPMPVQFGVDGYESPPLTPRPMVDFGTPCPQNGRERLSGKQ